MIRFVGLLALLIGGCLQDMVGAQSISDDREHVTQWLAPETSSWVNSADRFRLQNRFRVPGEFEPHEYLLMAVSGDHVHSKTIARIIREIGGSIQPIVLAGDAFDRHQLLQDLDEYGVDTDEVTILCIEHDSKWCRDFGPTSLISRHEVRLLDWTYSDERKLDDDVSMQLAAISRTRVQFTPLSFEGGNLLSNGNGLVITSEKLVFQNLDHGALQTADELKKQLGADQLLVLEPLIGEGTAHVDMFATFTSPTTIVVGSYDPEVDPDNAGILDRNAQALSKVLTRHGRLNVVRIPMGSREGDCWRTYTNCIFANGVLVVPTYGDYDDSEVMKQVLDTYRELLPGWKVTTVDSQSLIGDGGALRCASLGISRLNIELESTPDSEFPAVRTDLASPQLERSDEVEEIDNWDFVDQGLIIHALGRHYFLNQRNPR